MSDWLVTFSRTLDEDRRRAIIETAGAKLRAGVEAVPLGSEVAVSVTADDAAAKALQSTSEVIAVYPDSEMTGY